MKKRIIEFVGFPGVGKSKVLSVIQDANLYDIISTEDFYEILRKKSRIHRVFFFMLYSIMNIESFFMRLAYIKKIKTSFKKKIAILVKAVFYEYSFCLVINKFRGNVILDQGILQNEWSVFLEFDQDFTTEVIEKIKKIINKKVKYSSYIPIFFEDESSEIANRAIKRDGECVFDHYSIQMLTDLYEKHKNDITIMINEFDESSKYFGVKELIQYMNFLLRKE